MARCPKTAAEAWKRLDKRLTLEEKQQIVSSHDMSEFHFGLGMWIRNHWIYTGEQENKDSLAKDLGEKPECFNGDMASSAILHAYYTHLAKIMGSRSQKMYWAADEMFEEYGDGSLEVDMLFNYSDLFDFCDDELLDTFDVSYNTEVEFFPEEERGPYDPPYMYDDPAIIWTPKKENPLGKLQITCRGYEFDNGQYIACGVNENNKKQAQQCAELLNKYWR